MNYCEVVQTADLSEIHDFIDHHLCDDYHVVLSEDAADLFAENGFVLGGKAIGDEMLGRLRTDLSEMLSPDFAADSRFYEFHTNESVSGDVLFHALGAWRVSPSFHDLIFHSPIVKAAETLLGGPVRLWHDQIFAKPANDGGFVAWHQDHSYWTRTEPITHLTCWIALDDATQDNGCVNYIPGSHRWPLLPRGKLADDMDAVIDRLSDQQRSQFRPFAAEMPAGSCSFHHSMTVHGSFPNRSPRPRRGAVINFILDGVRSASDEPLLDGVPVVPPGEKLQGQFFPLLNLNSETR
ncbi:MAG TPA: phytanoyl-CoA dioxygenase family protein [Pyrinomonadaceae bacterium]|nr:phytanoyl-CoA dioxygenase family protein [Pyrinomonadaceae bacterium]